MKTLDQAAPTVIPWLWQGYLAAGAVTLLTGQWKSGKTTLASVLLARLKSGGAFAGLPLVAGRALVLSEESPQRWRQRAQHLDFGDHVGWICRPFKGRPTPAQWSALLDRITELHAQRGLALVLIDPLAAFMTGHENDAGSMLSVLMPLQRLTTLDLSVLVLHHPAKGKFRSGQAARGSGALSGFADILIEMRCYRRATDSDRRRRLQAYSRYDETPRQHVIELTADGTDYLGHGSFQDDEFTCHWPSLRSLLETAARKLTRREIREQWPAERRPDESTLYRLLERAVERGVVTRDGKGLRNSPFRYWQPGREEIWKQDSMNYFHMPELFDPPPSSP